MSNLETRDQIILAQMQKIANILEIQHQRFRNFNHIIDCLNERMDILSERIDKLEDWTNGRT